MYWNALKGKKLVVVDASVILKWVLPEEQEENVLEALSLRDAIVAETGTDFHRWERSFPIEHDRWGING